MPIKNQLFFYSYLLGVKGIIYDQDGKVVPSATLKIKGRELVSFRSSKYGEYWRILLPGTYTLQVTELIYKIITYRFRLKKRMNCEHVLKAFANFF